MDGVELRVRSCRSRNTTEYGAEFQVPLSEESENGVWLLHRLQGVCRINLGSAAAPLGLSDNCIVQRMLAKLQAPVPSLALHLSDMGASAYNLRHPHFSLSNEHWRLCRSRTTAQSPTNSASAELVRLTDRRAKAVVTAPSAHLHLDWPDLPEAAFHRNTSTMDDGGHAPGQLEKTTSAQACFSTKAANAAAAVLLPKLPSLQSLAIGPGLSSQDLLQICTLTGLTYLQLQFTGTDPESMMNGILMDSLTNLQVLNELKLSCPPRLPLLLSKLASLESLTVAPGTAATLDMPALTQVCSLRLSQGYRTDIRVLVVLPAGPEARLLALATHMLCDTQSLQEANNLTHIEASVKPRIMHAFSWSTALLHLQCFTVCKDIDHHMLHDLYMLPHHYMLHTHCLSYCYMLPDEWQHYTQLKVLCLHQFEGRSLPVWFSKFQQLNVLSMPDARMDGVPECLFQLSQLKHLDLSRFQDLLTMPIVKLADLPQLTYLKFGKLKHTVPHYEQAVLLDLETALSKRELKLIKEHPNEWTYTLDTCR